MITALIAVIGGLFALLFGKSALDHVCSENEKVAVAKKIVENHAVAQKMEAAHTDKEIDDALDADARSDR